MRKKKGRVLKFVLKALWFIIQIPYYFVIGVVSDIVGLFFGLAKSTHKRVSEKKVMGKRENVSAAYDGFEIIEKEKGDISKLEKGLMNKSKIGIILGARGSGKTAFGVRMLENIYSK